MKKNGFATLKILHIAMLVAQIFFSAVFFYLAYSKTVEPSLQAEDKIFQLVAIALAAIAFFAGNYLFKRKMQQLKDDTLASLKDKFVQYRTACLVQWALLEAATFFSGISFLFTGNYAFLALAAVLILLFALLAPNKTKIALQLGVGLDDVNEL